MPWPRDSAETFERFVAQHRTGPFFRLHYVREGVDPNSPGKLLKGTFHYFTVAALVAALALLAGGSFARKFSVIALAGLLGSDFITIGDPVWFHMPWDYTRGVLLFEILSWLLLALGADAATMSRLLNCANPQMKHLLGIGRHDQKYCPDKEWNVKGPGIFSPAPYPGCAEQSNCREHSVNAQEQSIMSERFIEPAIDMFRAEWI